MIITISSAFNYLTRNIQARPREWKKKSKPKSWKKHIRFAAITDWKTAHFYSMQCERKTFPFYCSSSFQQTWMWKMLAHNQFHFNGFTFSLKNFFHIPIQFMYKSSVSILLFLCAVHYIIINNITGCYIHSSVSMCSWMVRWNDMSCELDAVRQEEWKETVKKFSFGWL